MEILHDCLAVEDVYEAAKTIEHLTGIGPFELFDPNYTNMRIYGKLADFKMRFGFTQAGPIKLELAQVLSGETIYDDFLKRKYGLYHIRAKRKTLNKRLKKWH